MFGDYWLLITISQLLGNIGSIDYVASLACENQLPAAASCFQNKLLNDDRRKQKLENNVNLNKMYFRILKEMLTRSSSTVKLWKSEMACRISFSKRFKKKKEKQTKLP